MAAKLIDKLYDANLLTDDEDVILSDGFDDAIIGVTATNPKRVVYDYYKSIDLIMKSENDVDIDDAVEWLDEHTSFDLGAATPIFIKKL